MDGSPRFVFASDSLKGTLSSADAARLLEGAARRHFTGCTCVTVPMADGGDGTVAALVAACGGELRHARVCDPLGRPVDAAYAMLPGGHAVIEMAAASGLPLLSPDEKNPLLTNTYGTGELIRAALDAGALDVTLAIGGSATNDGGMGCARALGVRFLDASGRELAGADLCVTGEGHADAQTARGKVVAGVAAACEAAGVPCVAVVGGMGADAAQSVPGVCAWVPTAIDAMPLDEALSRAEELYSLAAERFFSLLELGSRLS